jgi:hypothetical protein
VGDKPGGEAIGVLKLDSEPSDEALEAVISATVVHLPAAGQRPVWLD